MKCKDGKHRWHIIDRFTDGRNIGFIRAKFVCDKCGGTKKVDLNE